MKKIFNFSVLAIVLIVACLHLNIFLVISLLALSSIIFIYRQQIIFTIINETIWYLVLIITAMFSVSVFLMFQARELSSFWQIIMILVIISAFIFFAFSFLKAKYKDQQEEFLKNLPLEIIMAYFYALLALVSIAPRALIALLFLVINLFIALSSNLAINIKLCLVCQRLYKKINPF